MKAKHRLVPAGQTPVRFFNARRTSLRAIVASNSRALRERSPFTLADVARETARETAREVAESQRNARALREVDFVSMQTRLGALNGRVRETEGCANVQTVWTTGETSRAVNPFYDAAQARYEREEVETRNVIRETVRKTVIAKGGEGCAMGAGARIQQTHTVLRVHVSEKARGNYRAFLATLAQRIAEKYISRAKVSCAHLRSEFVAEIESAIGLALATRVSRFPRLASDLLARFACDALPNSTRRALHFAALKACDARVRHLAKNETHETSYFDAFDETPETTLCDESKLARINARCDSLLRTLAEKESRATSNRERGALRSARKQVERAREWAIASVQSERFAFAAPLSFHAETTTETHLVREGGRFARKLTYERATGKTLTRSALWKRAERLGKTLGLELV